MTLSSLPSSTKRLLVLSALFGALVTFEFRSHASDATAPAAAVSQTVRAAEAFLSTLNEQQRAKVVYTFDENGQRARWSNFPTRVVPRGGLGLKDLTDAQRSAVRALLKSVLSEKGFEKVEEIREADDAFKAHPQRPPFPPDKHGGANPPPFGDHKNGPAGQPPFHPPGGGGPHGPGHLPPGGDLFGSDLYYISFLGTPSEENAWMLQFGGHHLALNITVVAARGVLTPSLTGAQPATFQFNGKTVRPLGPENDKAFALMNALNDDQRKQAVLNYKVDDLVLGPGHDGETIQPEGLKASAMNEKQRALLLDLISEWAGIVNDGFAAARMEEIKAGLNDAWFAWSGPTTVEAGKNGTSYYRIQGPKLVIEYAPQQEADHVHTIYRDPTNDYGAALTRKR
jgi:hypothetical protein